MTPISNLSIRKPIGASMYRTPTGKRPHRGALLTMIEQCLVSMLCISLIITPVSAIAADQAGEAALSFETALERVNHQLDALEETRSLIDRSRFDPEELLLVLDYEADLALRFVGENIVFQQYPGLLRGARGTLMSRSGNALDQAVLLATLLRDAGLEARILRTTLTPDDSRILLQQMRSPAALPVSDAESTDTGSNEDSLATIDDPNDPPSPNLLPTNQDIDAATEEILDLLADHEIALGDPQMMERLAQEAADYFWVEHRLGPSQEWRQEHPVFANQSDAFEGLRHQQAFSDTIPDDLLHQIRFTASIEQRRGPKLSIHQIMDDWQKPVANLLGRSLAFFSLPSTFTEESLNTDLNTAFEGAGLFVPIFDGQPAPGAQAFDRRGNIIALDVLSMDQVGASGVFKTAADKTSAATDALQSLGSDEDGDKADFTTLTAQWVDYTLIAPGGRETHYRRMIFDRLGPTARQNRDFAGLDPDYRFNRLSSAHSFVVAAGNYPRSFILDQFLNDIVSTKSLMTRGLQGRFSKDQTNTFSQALSETTPLSPTLALFALFERQNPAEPHLITYRPEPSIIALQGGVEEGEAGGVFYAVDIIHNARRTFTRADKGIIPAPEENIRQGVQETFFEGFAINPGGQATARQFGVKDGLQRARQQGSILTVLSSKSKFNIDALPVHEDVKLRINAHVEGGKIAITPTSPLADDQIVWWHIDPRTGTTLGYLNNGTGGAATEYLAALTVGVTLGTALAWAIGQTDFLGCYAAGHRGKSQDCCSERKRNGRWKGWALGLKFHAAYRRINSLEIDRQRTCGELNQRPPAATRPVSNKRPQVKPPGNFPAGTRPSTGKRNPGKSPVRPRKSMPAPTRPATQNN